MSHLRAPAARADRRDGGRHGRPGGRSVQVLPEAHIRSQLLRVAVLPALAVALCACAVVLFTVRSQGRTGPALWGVLAGAAVLALVALAVAAYAADRAARSVRDRVGVLRRATARSEADLRALVEGLGRGDGPPPARGPAVRQGLHAARTGTEDADDLDLLADELTRAQEAAHSAVVRASQASGRAGSEQKVEVFVNVARRMQSLVHREIAILDELENEIEDPELLGSLFHVDHLATRLRRHAENLAVLGGAVSRRQWSSPVSMTEVLRSAIAEVEQYARVKLVPPVEGTLRGHAVADVVHLLAELVENASVFSAPHTEVLLRVSPVTAGLAVEVEDRGLGMPAAEQSRMNALLRDPDRAGAGHLLQDGRIGLFVVSQLSRRHGIAVRLQTNIYGGIQAVVILPQILLGGDPDEVTITRPARQAPALPAPPDTAPAPPGPGTSAPRYGYEAPAGHPETTGIRPSPTASGAAETGPRGPEHGTGETEARSRETGASPAYENDAAFPYRSEGTGHPPLPSRGRHAQRRTEPAPRGGAEVPAEGRARPSPAPPRPASPPSAGGPAPAATPGGPASGEAGAVTPSAEVSGRRGVGRPRLPRRRAQEHIAPQLRDGPGTRQAVEEPVGHDPGLMAAFRRGVGLADAEDEPVVPDAAPSVPTQSSGQPG